MAVTSPPFDIQQLTEEQQRKFRTVYNELQPTHTSYVEHKRSLQLNNNWNNDQEENEWCYELHRYLRAKKWDVNRTNASVREMIQWRINNHVDSILEDESMPRRMNLLRRVVPSADHGHTKAPRPLCIEKPGRMHVSQLLQQFSEEELIRCHIYWLELHCQLARNLSQQTRKHVESFAMITDLHGIGLEIRNAVHLFKKSIYIDDNYYPERLGQIFIVHAPRIFSIIWNLVNYWIDPVTKTKIHFIRNKSDIPTTLLEHIDRDQLPVEYGGSCNTCATAPDCVPVYDWNRDTPDEE